MQERERIEAEYKANGLEYCGCLDWNKDGEFKQHTVNTMNDYHKKLHTVGVTPAESEAYYF